MDQWILNAGIVILVAFVPSLLYLVWIRNTERFSREPYGRLLWVFSIGAILSVGVAIVLEIILSALFDQNIERVYQYLGENPNLSSLVLACVIAPVVEELAKALGVFRVRSALHELENGIVYGAAAGLGFAATENLLYEGTAFITAGTEAWIATAALRSVSSALLHASASSVVGFGIAKSTLNGSSWVPYYIIAVLMHGSFNFAASFGALYADQMGDAAYLIGLAAAFAIAIIGIIAVRGKIRSLDRGRGWRRARRR
jgi:RsiW-degrading membrane proteinase PrsW (M82 family)